jgi:hypothetical protein
LNGSCSPLEPALGRGRFFRFHHERFFTVVIPNR